MVVHYSMYRAAEKKEKERHLALFKVTTEPIFRPLFLSPIIRMGIAYNGDSSWMPRACATFQTKQNSFSEDRFDTVDLQMSLPDNDELRSAKEAALQKQNLIASGQAFPLKLQGVPDGLIQYAALCATKDVENLDKILSGKIDPTLRAEARQVGDYCFFLRLQLPCCLFPDTSGLCLYSDRSEFSVFGSLDGP